MVKHTSSDPSSVSNKIEEHAGLSELELDKWQLANESEMRKWKAEVRHLSAVSFRVHAEPRKYITPQTFSGVDAKGRAFLIR